MGRAAMKAILHCLGNIGPCAGRESRGFFWTYAAAILILGMIGMAAVLVPIMADTMVKMQKFAMAHPESATIASGPGQYSISIQGNHPDLMPDFGAILPDIAAAVALIVLLVAAAV